MSKKTLKKVSLNDKDLPARQAKEVMGGDSATPPKTKAQPQPFVFVHTFDKASPVL